MTTLRSDANAPTELSPATPAEEAAPDDDSDESEETMMRSRSHSNRDHERETPLERARVGRAAAREDDRLWGERPSMRGAHVRSAGRAPGAERDAEGVRDGRRDELGAEGPRAEGLRAQGPRARPLPERDSQATRELLRFAADAETIRRESPVKFSAVERDVERLRDVEKLQDPRQLKIEFERHAALLEAERDAPTAMRLYTRTLALSTLLVERQAERGEALRSGQSRRDPREGSTTIPFPVQQALRPLPVLLDFDDERSLSVHTPLENRVHRLELSSSPLVRVRDELDTDPMSDPMGEPTRNEASDVFMSLRAVRPGAREPGQGDVHDGPTAKDVPKVDDTVERPRPVSLTSHIGARVDRRADPLTDTQELPRRSRPQPDQRSSDERRLRDNAREREQMRGVYASERTYLEVRQREPERAGRISALSSTLQFAPELRTREQALVAHARASRARASEMNPDLHRPQEDNVMALGLLARQRDDDHHAASRVAREQLAVEARQLSGAMREALRSDLKELLVRDGSRDAQYLRREMMRSLEAGAKDDARVLALALDAHPHRPFLTPDDGDESGALRVSNSVADGGRTQVSAADAKRLERDLVELRAAHALRELTAADLVRAERVARVLSSVRFAVKERAEAAPEGERSTVNVARLMASQRGAR